MRRGTVTTLTAAWFALTLVAEAARAGDAPATWDPYAGAPSFGADAGPQRPVIAYAGFLHPADGPVREASKGAPAQAEEKERESPWLLAPIVSVDPKLGASVGALAGYLHYFDEKSRVSMFGVSAQYTSTGSVVAGAFAKTSFDEDHDRITGGMFGGKIFNDYHDFLGTGQRVKTEDDLRAFVARYLHRVVDDWFVGVQGAYSNFSQYGETQMDNEVLETLGLTGFTSGGVGLAIYHDSRDSDTMPTHGWMLNLNNLAYRDWIAGDSSFDAYRADFRLFLPHGDGNVFAIRQYNQWTSGAPASGESTVILRGYKQGEYKGENMSSIEAEERLRLGRRWTATVFAGIAGLYGDGRSASDNESRFPAAGAGIQYVLKEDAGIVLNLEYALGKDGNYGVYLKMGYNF